MSFLLHIDTAVDTASVCLSNDEQVLGLLQNTQTRESAAWLQPAIRNLLQDAGVQMQQLAAVSVSAGPGSYTGLRVGMASAKGLCYALNIPLITVGTLQVMASAALPQVAEEDDVLLCPMIDARRMEVFTAIYNRNLEEVMQPINLVLHENIFDEWLSLDRVYFFGNGSDKAKPLLQSPSARFILAATNAASLVPLAFAQFTNQQFAPLAYAEPLYVKAFYSTQP